MYHLDSNVITSYIFENEKHHEIIEKFLIDPSKGRGMYDLTLFTCTLMYLYS
jgi:predicted nucleic acid-binding protein